MIRQTISAIIVALACIGTVHAGIYPKVGDQFRYDNGKVVEVVKVRDENGDVADTKLCMRPVGNKVPCTWTKTGDLVRLGDFIIYDGEKQ
jgi:hypothetical protein